MAYQPIVDVPGDTVFAHEALLRGSRGENARTVLESVPKGDSVAFDARCRRAAIQLACSLGLTFRLSLNIAPEAICSNRHGPMDTILAARHFGFHADRLILEITERSTLNLKLARKHLGHARDQGILVALDDFGAGYSGLNTLVSLRPDIVKMDIGLVDRIDTCDVRQTVVASLVEACDRLGILVIAEGVETALQYRTLRALGVELMQGYFLARPAVGALPSFASATPPSVQRATGT